MRDKHNHNPAGRAPGDGVLPRRRSLRWPSTRQGTLSPPGLFNLPLESVEVRTHRLSSGVVHVGSTRVQLPVPSGIVGRGAEAALPRMVQMMAGPAAERQADSNYNLKINRHARDREDMERTANVAVCCLDDSPADEELPSDVAEARLGEAILLCARAAGEAGRFVTKNRAAIEAVATALIRKTSLTRDEVAALGAAATTA